MVQDSSSRGTYTVQYNMELKDYKPPTIVPAGELICDAYWLNPVHNCNYWYTASCIKTVVIIKKLLQVILKFYLYQMKINCH